jgi:hypothetical protein
MISIQEECYKKSIAVLKKNSTKFGILASGKTAKAQQRSYLSIFGRDASICSMGMVLSGDKQLVLSARRSLETLAKYQATNGQIPFWVKPEKKQADFYYTGCIDSALWWLIAIKFFDKNSNYNLTKKLKLQIDKTINWLSCQEHPNFYLVQQNEASDWADLMPRTGFVLYSNALWYWVKKLYRLDDADQTKKYFNYILNPSTKVPKDILVKNSRLAKLLADLKPKKKSPLYLSFVNRGFWGEEGDVFGNILAATVGLAEEKQVKQIIAFLKKEKANYPHPVKTVLKPIKRKGAQWRSYMGHLNLNNPEHYHNGGIWPYIGGFWVILLSITDEKFAQEELVNLAKLNKKNNWQFNEWFDGKNGRAMGMSEQSWNAAMFLMTHKTLIE